MQTIDTVIFDVDGTTFDYRSMSVLPSTEKAVADLRRKGIRVIIASGRSYGLLGREVLTKIPADFYLLANGHSVLDSTGQGLLSRQFSLPQTERIIALCQEYGASLLLKYPTINCVYAGYEEMYRVFGSIGLLQEDFLNCPAMSYHRNELPIGFTVKGDRQIAEAIAADPLHFRVELFHDESEFDVFLPDCNKLTGLRFLMEREGLDPQRCMAFGDSRNDLEIVREVGVGIAMGNACDELKAVADRVCPPTWEDGIAVALTEAGLLDKKADFD